MLKLDVGFDEKQMSRVRKALQHIPGGAERAMSRAINKALDKAKTSTVRYVCSLYCIKPAKVRRHIRVIRSNTRTISGMVITSGRPIDLMQFVVSPKKLPNQQGVLVSKRKKVSVGVKFGVKKMMPHAFVVQMKSGHLGIFSRSTVSSNPINQHYTVAVPQMVSNFIIEHISVETQAVMGSELERQIELLGGKA